MKNYDVIVIGSGSGMYFVEEAEAHGLSVALVDRGPLGGTCANLGCIPSKLLIYPAYAVAEIQEAQKLGITVEIKNIDFKFIMERQRKSVRETQDGMRHGLTHAEHLDFYENTAHFIADYTLEVDGEQLKADKKIFIVSGSRPLIPPIPGLDQIDYLTNESVLQLKTRPASLIIIGGGYIAVEYAHFFAAMGTKVTVVEMTNRLVPNEEPEISALLQKSLSRRMEVYTHTQAESVKQDNTGCTVLAKDAKGLGRTFTAERIMVAAGRRSNSDLLKPENTGVATDERGYIKVNDYLETTKKNIFASGDATGKQMFTHVANREALVAWHNSVHKEKTKMDFSAAPHAIFTHPQIAAVGLTEAEARKQYDVLVGVAGYSDVAAGEAMGETEGFVKAIVEKDTGKILGCHIIGPHAATVIQEVIDAMAHGGDMGLPQMGMHIHPALPELIIRAFNNLE